MQSSVRNFPLPFVRALALLLLSDVTQPHISDPVQNWNGWAIGIWLKTEKERGREKTNQTNLTGELLTEKKKYFLMFICAHGSDMDFKNYTETTGHAQRGLLKPEQPIPVLCSVMSCFYECIWRGRAFPQECYMCPSREPGCWVSTEGSGLLPACRGRALFGGCSPTVARGPP